MGKGHIFNIKLYSYHQSQVIKFGLMYFERLKY